MILFWRGSDDMVTFYTFVVDSRNPDLYRSSNGKIVDRYNNITWDKFLEIDKLACKYEGPKDGFMEEFRNLFIR